MIYNSVQEEGNIYTVLKNSNKKYVDNFEVIKGELFYFSQNEKEKKWAQEIGIKVSPYIIIDGELMSSNTNLDLMDKATGTIIIPQNVTKIGDGAFRDLTGLRSIVIPGTVKEIGEYAFSGNPTLENVVIEEGVEKIGASAFRDCANLKKIRFPKSVTEIGIYCMCNCGSLDNVELPPNIICINAGTFERCSGLRNIKLPENLKKIDGFAFAYNLIEKIEIPDSVTEIYSNSFVGLYKLTEMVLGDKSVYKYENGILMTKTGTDILFVSDSILKNTSTFYIPEGIKTYGYYISAYTNIKELVIPKSLKTIIIETLPNTIETIKVDTESESYIVENKCLYTKDKKRIVACFSKEKNIEFAEGAERLGASAFRLTINAENITLPESLKVIEKMALSSLGICKKIKFGKNVQNIDPQCMLYKYDVSVTIDEANPYYKIIDNVIYSKNGEKIVAVLSQINGEFILDNNVKEIGTRCFYYQIKMSSITINSNISSIGAEAFYLCEVLKEIKIDKKELEGPTGAPWGCPYGLRAVFWKK